jgi:hypothetical protein
MRHGSSQTGICVVRVEAQGQELLITIRTNLDIEHLSGEHVQTVADMQTAVRVVSDFLTGFATASKAC